MRRTPITLIAAAAALTFILTGCGDSTATDRSAAAVAVAESVEPTDSAEPVEPTDLPAEEEEVISVEEPETIDDPAPAEPEPTEESAGSDESAGSKLCIQNDASNPVTIVAGLGQRKPLDIAPGSRQCSENFNPFASKDVKGTLAVNGVDVMRIATNNPFIGLASVEMFQPSGSLCLMQNLGRQGMMSTAKDDGVLRYQFERLTPFSLKPQQIEFRLVLQDSSSPSSSGRPRTCS